MVVSDTHLMAPELYEGSDLLERALRSGDGKVSHRSRELADALVAEALHQRPDVLLVTGDISMNGEYRSHLFAAQTLRRIADAGIQVCVIPGNHDIGVFAAYDYSGEALRGTNTVDEALFAKIYADFMPGEALAGCPLSYVVRLDGVWLLMLNTCYYDEDGPIAAGYLREGLLEEAERVFQEARDAGAAVICATHQSLLPHSDFKASMFSVYEGERLLDLMARYDVRLNLSGHVHAQHLLEHEGVWDAALGGFCLSPQLYDMVTVGEDGHIRYQAQPVCGEHLPEGFAEEARAFFIETTIAKNADSGIEDAALAEQALALKAELNYAYFNGTLHTAAAGLDADPIWQRLLAQEGETFFVQHLRQMIGECPEDMRTVEIE